MDTASASSQNAAFSRLANTFLDCSNDTPDSKPIDMNKNINQNKVLNILKQYYKGKKFIKIAKKDTFLSTNDVIGTNKCIISVCKSKYKDKIIILSAIDNLIKGGSGQAVQNMNLRFGLKENEGIQ